MANKKKNVVARLGNFVITQESGNGFDWVSVRAVSGFWTVRYRSDGQVYSMIMQTASDESLHPYLENWIVALYVMAQAIPDLDFYADFHKAYTEMNARMQETHTEEEDRENLNLVRTLEEMKDEASREEGLQ